MAASTPTSTTSMRTSAGASTVIIRSGGSWHTQPTTIKPSPADLATWRHAHMHAHSRHRAWRQVHLILAPGKARPERRWRRPQIGAYTLRREDDSLGYRYLCEPATIILP